jgi:hypothetical protein
MIGSSPSCGLSGDAKKLSYKSISQSSAILSRPTVCCLSGRKKFQNIEGVAAFFCFGTDRVVLVGLPPSPLPLLINLWNEWVTGGSDLKIFGMNDLRRGWIDKSLDSTS